MRRIRTYNEVGPAGESVPEQVVAQRDRLARRLAAIRAVVAVASGKGGVGKSALTANLAAALASDGLRVGALDSDLNGPSLARMLGVAGSRLAIRDDGVEPPEGAAGVRVVSMELFQEGADAPLRWHGPAGDGWVWRNVVETGTLRELVSDVQWGPLDVLLVDVAPGTDRIARLLELIPRPAAVLLVTTPSEMTRRVVARSIRLAREAGLERVGLVENMAGWTCPDCGAHTDLFEPAGPEPEAPSIERWGSIPFDPRLARATDEGRPFVLTRPDAPAAQALRGLAARLAREIGA